MSQPQRTQPAMSRARTPSLRHSQSLDNIRRHQKLQDQRKHPKTTELPSHTLQNNTESAYPRLRRQKSGPMTGPFQTIRKAFGHAADGGTRELREARLEHYPDKPNSSSSKSASPRQSPIPEEPEPVGIENQQVRQGRRVPRSAGSPPIRIEIDRGNADGSASKGALHNIAKLHPISPTPRRLDQDSPLVNRPDILLRTPSSPYISPLTQIDEVSPPNLQPMPTISTDGVSPLTPALFIPQRPGDETLPNCLETVPRQAKVPRRGSPFQQNPLMSQQKTTFTVATQSCDQGLIHSAEHPSTSTEDLTETGPHAHRPSKVNSEPTRHSEEKIAQTDKLTGYHMSPTTSTQFESVENTHTAPRAKLSTPAMTYARKAMENESLASRVASLEERLESVEEISSNSSRRWNTIERYLKSLEAEGMTTALRHGRRSRNRRSSGRKASSRSRSRDTWLDDDSSSESSVETDSRPITPASATAAANNLAKFNVHVMDTGNVKRNGSVTSASLLPDDSISTGEKEGGRAREGPLRDSMINKGYCYSMHKMFSVINAEHNARMALQADVAAIRLAMQQFKTNSEVERRLAVPVSDSGNEEEYQGREELLSLTRKLKRVQQQQRHQEQAYRKAFSRFSADSSDIADAETDADVENTHPSSTTLAIDMDADLEMHDEHATSAYKHDSLGSDLETPTATRPHWR